MPDLPLDEVAAANALAAYNMLRLPDVHGTPLLAEAGGDWFREIIAALFGSLVGEGAEMRRMVQEIFVLVPKKNSKTTNAGALMLLALILNVRPEAEFFLFGPSLSIAGTAFDQIEGMIKNDRSGQLQKWFQVKEYNSTIVDLRNDSRLEVKTLDSKIATGILPAGALIDELHTVSQMRAAAKVIRQIRGGMVARPESFLMFITTQSEDQPAGVFKEELHIARSIRDGKLTGPAAKMLPILYEFPEDIQTSKDKKWEDTSLWHAVHPNLGKSLTLDWMIADYATEKEKGEHAKQLWATQHLNVEVGLALHSKRWRGADHWTKCTREGLDLDHILQACDVAVIGIDAGGGDDLLGLCVAGIERVTGNWLYWFHAWARPTVFEQRKDIAVRLQDFIDQGDLTKVEYVNQDLEEIVQICHRVRAAALMPEEEAIGVDPLGLPQMITALNDAGYMHPQIASVGQGYRLTSAITGLERGLEDQTCAHGGQPIMDWVLGNAVAERRGNALLITKENASDKIDPLAAGLNATKLLEIGPVAAKPKESVYEKRGLVVLG